MAIDMWKSVDDLSAFIGDGCSTVCQPLSLLSAAWGIPVISWGCTSDSLSNKDVYPTFTRVEGTWAILAPVLDDLADQFGWQRFGIIYTPEDIMLHTALAIAKVMDKSGKTVITQVIPTIMHGTEINLEKQKAQQNILHSLKEQARIFIFMCYPLECLNLLMSMKNVGMFNGQYAFILLKDTITESHPLFEGVIVVGTRKPSGLKFDTFLSKVPLAFNDLRFDDVPHLQEDEDIRNIHVYAGMCNFV